MGFINTNLFSVSSETITTTISDMARDCHLSIDAEAVVATARKKLQKEITYVALNCYVDMFLIAFFTGNPAPKTGEFKVAFAYVYNLSAPEFSELGSVVVGNDIAPYYAVF